MKLWPLIFLAASTLVFGDELCSKKRAEEKVNDMCKQISTKGEAIKSDWGSNLFYQNCGKNYIWIQDTSPEIKMVIHPIKKRLVGQVIGKLMDNNKLVLFRKFDTEAKAHPTGAWIDHVWPKPGVEKATPKTSFVKLCKLPSGTAWIVGSGVWLEDLK